MRVQEWMTSQICFGFFFCSRNWNRTPKQSERNQTQQKEKTKYFPSVCRVKLSIYQTKGNAMNERFGERTAEKNNIKEFECIEVGKWNETKHYCFIRYSSTFLRLHYDRLLHCTFHTYRVCLYVCLCTSSLVLCLGNLHLSYFQSHVTRFHYTPASA